MCLPGANLSAMGHSFTCRIVHRRTVTLKRCLLFVPIRNFHCSPFPGYPHLGATNKCNHIYHIGACSVSMQMYFSVILLVVWVPEHRLEPSIGHIDDRLSLEDFLITWWPQNFRTKHILRQIKSDEPTKVRTAKVYRNISRSSDRTWIVPSPPG